MAGRQIRGSSVVVTGGSRVLGLEVAGAFASEGAAAVALVARSTSALEAACERLSGAFPACAFHAIPADLSQAAERDQLVDSIQRLFGGNLDILVNGAGVEEWGPFETTTPEAIDLQIEVNLAAPIHLSKALLPDMLAHGGGSIVNLASLAGKLGSPNSAAYTASKLGLVGFTRALRSEYARRRIGCSVVCPSFVQTALLDQLIAKAGGARPPLITTTSAAAVSRACVSAVTDDTSELIVNLAPTRPLLVLYEAFPELPRVVERLAPWLYGFNRKCGVEASPAETPPDR